MRLFGRRKSSSIFSRNNKREPLISRLLRKPARSLRAMAVLTALSLGIATTSFGCDTDVPSASAVLTTGSPDSDATTKDAGPIDVGPETNLDVGPELPIDTTPKDVVDQKDTTSQETQDALDVPDVELELDVPAEVTPDVVEVQDVPQEVEVVDVPEVDVETEAIQDVELELDVPQEVEITPTDILEVQDVHEEVEVEVEEDPDPLVWKDPASPSCAQLDFEEVPANTVLSLKVQLDGVNVDNLVVHPGSCEDTVQTNPLSHVAFTFDQTLILTRTLNPTSTLAVYFGSTLPTAHNPQGVFDSYDGLTSIDLALWTCSSCNVVGSGVQLSAEPGTVAELTSSALFAPPVSLMFGISGIQGDNELSLGFSGTDGVEVSYSNDFLMNARGITRDSSGSSSDTLPHSALWRISWSNNHVLFAGDGSELLDLNSNVPTTQLPISFQLSNTALFGDPMNVVVTWVGVVNSQIVRPSFDVQFLDKP